MKSAPLQGEFLGWFPFSLIVRAGHPLLEPAPKQKTKQKAPQQKTQPQKIQVQQYSYPVLSPGQFSNIDSWPVYFQRYLTGPLHLIEDYGVASRITELTDAIWLSSTFAAMFEIRAGRLQEIAPPKGQKPFRFKMMMYRLNRRSLSPAAVMLKEMFQQQFGELTAHSSKSSR